MPCHRLQRQQAAAPSRASVPAGGGERGSSGPPGGDVTRVRPPQAPAGPPRPSQTRPRAQEEVC